MKEEIQKQIEKNEAQIQMTLRHPRPSKRRLSHCAELGRENAKLKKDLKMLEYKEQHRESRIIEQFKQSFFERFGYYPVVISKVENALPVMPLDELVERFLPYAPELCSPSRSRAATDTRSMFCFLARNMKHTLNSIGERLGRRKHSTVKNCLQTFHDLIETSEAFQSQYLQIVGEIKKQLENKKQ